MPGNVEELRAVARALHAHYEVEPQLELRDGARVKAGLLVRLWGVHPKGARALPGCAKCREIVSRLQPILDYALDHETSMRIAVEPFRRALYASRVIPDADEVALAIRLSPPGGGEGVTPAGAIEERCVKAIRARLRELGVPER